MVGELLEKEMEDQKRTKSWRARRSTNLLVVRRCPRNPRPLEVVLLLHKLQLVQQFA